MTELSSAFPWRELKLPSWPACCSFFLSDHSHLSVWIKVQEEHKQTISFSFPVVYTSQCKVCLTLLTQESSVRILPPKTCSMCSMNCTVVWNISASDPKAASIWMSWTCYCLQPAVRWCWLCSANCPTVLDQAAVQDLSVATRLCVCKGRGSPYGDPTTHTSKHNQGCFDVFQ